MILENWDYVDHFSFNGQLQILLRTALRNRVTLVKIRVILIIWVLIVECLSIQQAIVRYRTLWLEFLSQYSCNRRVFPVWGKSTIFTRNIFLYLRLSLPIMHIIENWGDRMSNIFVDIDYKVNTSCILKKIKVIIQLHLTRVIHFDSPYSSENIFLNPLNYSNLL